MARFLGTGNTGNVQQQQQQPASASALFSSPPPTKSHGLIERARSFHGFRRDDKSNDEAAGTPGHAVVILDPHDPHDLHPSVAAIEHRAGGGIVKSQSSSVRVTRSGGGEGRGGAGSSNSSSAGGAGKKLHSVQAMAYHRPVVTSRQLDIVETQWNMVRQHIDTLGCDIFVKLFSTYPAIQRAWRPFRDQSTQDARFKETLRRHGVNVLGVIGRFLQVRDNAEAGVDLLHELGQRHVTYDAKMVFADIVIQQFLLAVKPLLGDEWTDESEQAWSDFFKFVVHVMRECTML